MNRQMKQVQLEQGVIEYIEAGEGLPVVLLHGALSNSYTWDSVLGPLSEQFRCIVPTLPFGGHNLPLAESADLSLFGVTDLLLNFVTTLKLDTFILVGNDTGGAYAQIFAAKHPDKVHSLVLSNCDTLDVFPPSQFVSLQRSIGVPFYTDLMALLFRFKPFLKTQMVLGLLSNSLSKESIYEHYVKGFIKNKDVRNNFKKVVKSWSTSYTQEAVQTLSLLDIPILLLWGTEDKKLFPVSLAKKLHENLPNSELVFIEGALAYVQVDQPTLFVKHFKIFMNKLLAKELVA